MITTCKSVRLNFSFIVKIDKLIRVPATKLKYFKCSLTTPKLCCHII